MTHTTTYMTILAPSLLVEMKALLLGTVMGTVMVTMTILTTVTMTVVPLTWTLKWTLVSLKIVYPGREGMLLIGTTSLSQKRLDGICPGYR
jgi:hypothetical protein